MDGFGRGELGRLVLNGLVKENRLEKLTKKTSEKRKNK